MYGNEQINYDDVYILSFYYIRNDTSNIYNIHRIY